MWNIFLATALVAFGGQAVMAAPTSSSSHHATTSTASSGHSSVSKGSSSHSATSTESSSRSTSAATRTVSFASSSPSGASVVPKDFVGFGFDGEFLDTYDNELSYNLVNSVAERMSERPIIRIGGTSSDRVTYVPDQHNATVCLKNATGGSKCPWGSGTYFDAGPTYFNGFQAFNNCRMSIQAPLSAHPDYDNMVTIVQKAYKALGANRLASIAIGNEVESYDSDKGNPSTYIDQVHQAQNKINSALHLTGDASRVYEVFDFGSESLDRLRGSNTSDTWSLKDAFKAGIDSNNNISVAAAHWYQIDGATSKKGITLQGTIMNHSAIVEKGKPYVDGIQYLKANKPNVAYALTETAAVEASSYTTPDFADVFGVALWSVDWQMYCMTQGVARISAGMRPQANHSLWVPVPNVFPNSVPQVGAPYYAQPFIADFVGNASASTSVVEKDLNDPMLTAYAAYEGSKLVRIAIVNLMEWSSGSKNSSRPKTTIELPVPKSVRKARLARLTARDGAYARGMDVDGKDITYAGQQWSANKGNGKAQPSTASFETPSVGKNGVLTISVVASEAVILHLS